MVTPAFSVGVMRLRAEPRVGVVCEVAAEDRLLEELLFHAGFVEALLGSARVGTILQYHNVHRTVVSGVLILT